MPILTNVLVRASIELLGVEGKREGGRGHTARSLAVYRAVCTQWSQAIVKQTPVKKNQL